MKQTININTYLSGHIPVRQVCYIGILLVFTFIVFYPSINHGFVNWDDNWMIIDNPLIRSLSLSNLKEIFFGEIFVQNYHPLTIFSFALEYHFFGLNPKVIHLTNVLLHLLNVLLVFIFIRSLTRQSRDKLIIAFITAALFALHPLRVESVTWATERKDVLYAFFFLLSLIQYVKYITLTTNTQPHAQSTHYLLALLFFLLSCLSKGMAVSLSLVIILSDYLFRRTTNVKAIIDKIPFIAISLFFGLVVTFAFYTEWTPINIEEYNLFERIQFAGYGVLFYLYKLIAPVNLSTFYPYPDYASGSLPIYYWIFPFAVLSLFCFIVYSTKFTRKLLFGFGFFIATIVFVLQLIQTNNAIVTDRYSYISSIGLFYLVGEGCSFLINSINTSFTPFVKYFKVLIIITILALSYSTFNRIKIWRNSLVLWTDVIEKHPDDKTGYFNRGSAYADLRNFHEAIKDFSKVIEIDPDYSPAYYNRGNVKAVLQYYEEAKRDFGTAIQLDPDNSEIYLKRGNVCVVLKDYNNAIKDFDTAIELNPNNPIYYYNRAGSMYYLNDIEKACDGWHKALELGHSPAAKLIKENCQ
ncbi:MAG: tetratricopeptide repeat protein [Bacteroidota bacterium]